jgi:3-methyladenine DNA glycosylase AlkC
MESVQSDGKSFSLKDKLFNKTKVEYLSNLIKNSYNKFDKNNFDKKIMKTLLDLELKERMTLITNTLYSHLPKNFNNAVDIMINSLPKVIDSEEWGDFIFGSYCEYIQIYGCNKENLEKSFYALEMFSEFFSGEFAIRDFINTFPSESFVFLEMMSKHKYFMCRRLASEGLRPKLPWAKKINYNYKLGAKLLNNLYFDNNRIVTRSVANHLNDISKIESNFVLEILTKWKNSKKQNSLEMNYIINHSVRGLIKAGDKQTLEFLGYSSEPRVCVLNFNLISNKIKLGEHIEFDFNLLADCDENLIVDYKITYPMPTGRLSTKVFKIKKFKIKYKNGKVKINKKHKFVPMSTKKLYAGNYRLELIINGNSYLEREFELIF